MTTFIIKISVFIDAQIRLAGKITLVVFYFYFMETNMQNIAQNVPKSPYIIIAYYRNDSIWKMIQR